MATISPVRASPAANIEQVTWETLTSADTAGSVVLNGLTSLAVTVQATGTFDSATLVMQGSNDASNWVTLKTPLGADVSLTAAGYAEVSTAFIYIRPSTSGGGGSQDIDVIVSARG